MLGANLINNRLDLFPAATTLYTVTGEGVAGCNVSDTVLIKVNRCANKFYFPNAFTPNNDGLNDIFKPTVDGNPKFYDLSIYGRWGELVFQSNNVRHGWNGYYKGNQLPGVYIWICKYKFINEEFNTIKGKVVLIK